MLDLTLRKEFQERNMPGTVVELHDGKKGAADIPAENFLELTYPTAMVMGQRKWKVPSGFPKICHGSLSLLEVASPWLEIDAK